MVDYKKIKDVTLKHGKKVGGIAVKSAVATASVFGPAKKIKLVGKGVKAVSTGVKILKPKVKKFGKAVESGAYKVLTSPITKKSVKKFEKVVGTGLNVATKATVAGTVLGLGATYSAIGKAINLGTKAYKKSKQKGSVARNVYAGTIKKVKKAVRSDTGKKVRKVAGKTYKGFQGTIMVGGLAPLVPISLGIMGAKAGTKLAIKHGGKAIKSLKAKLKNIYKDPK